MALHKIIDGVEIPLTDEEEAEEAAKIVAHEAAAPDRAFAALREERNQKLEATDYHGLSDVPMTDNMIQYRAALRALPEQYDESTILGEITFPVKP